MVTFNIIFPQQILAWGVFHQARGFVDPTGGELISALRFPKGKK